MSVSASDKQKLIDGLFAGIGVAVFGLNGPWLFQRFGLNVPEAAAAGALTGAVVGAGLAHLLMWRGARPEVAEPERTLRTGRMAGSSEEEATELRIERDLAGLLHEDGADIGVAVRGHKVVLRGTVHSWEEEADAERIAFDTPGIEDVENRLDVVK